MCGSMEIIKITRSGADALVEISITESSIGMPSVTRIDDKRLLGYGNKTDADIRQEVFRIVTEQWEQERLERL